MKMFKRRKPQIYLAGGMENAPNFGVAWRAKIEKWLISNGWHVHNPCTKETTIFKRRGVKGSTYHKLKTLKTLDVYQNIMRDLIDYDLSIIRQCDLILVYWDEYAKGGTIHELGYAREKGIPVVMMSRLPIKQVSGWVLGCTNDIFFRWKDIKKYIRGGMNVDRSTGRGTKRKRHSRKSNLRSIQGEKNVVRDTPEGDSAKTVRLVG